MQLPVMGDRRTVGPMVHLADGRHCLRSKHVHYNKSLSPQCKVSEDEYAAGASDATCALRRHNYHF